ncbi:uncharacterized aarF domain-containing protein kinase 5 isoform X2 [Hyperolius riggenbachi]|uniref:uncharacterized aarF domain-containing protein kinase 5 isoform X2 n=1 Tax=Hyperolius riggenbachi TaxID=752182 RepID=UPI0035A39072
MLKLFRLCRYHTSVLAQCHLGVPLSARGYSTEAVRSSSPRWLRIFCLSSLVGAPTVGALVYYSSDGPKRRKIRVSAQGILRFCRSLKVASQISIDYWWTRNIILRKEDENSSLHQAVMSQCHQRTADSLVDGALLNGGLYIKLGQGLCTFNHLLPPEYINTLRVLEDQALPRRANEDLKQTLAQELDFENEGRNAERCARDLRKLLYVLIPKVYWKYTSKRVLTADYCEGCKVNSVEGIKNQGLELKDVAEKVIKVFAEQIFFTGFIHADPHPGNVLVNMGPDGKARLVLLDHGLYEFLSERDRTALCKLWRSIVLRNRQSMAEYSAELGVKDYFLFCEILLQRPLSLTGTLGNALTREETQYMQDMAKEHFDDIMRVLRALPRPMLLVFRNLNTVRALNIGLGAPADRYLLMARSAVRAWRRLAKQNSSGITRWVSVMWEHLKFEVALRWESFMQHFTFLIIRLLIHFDFLADNEQIRQFLQA